MLPRAAQAPHHFEAVDAGNADIEHDDGNLGPLEHGVGFAPVMQHIDNHAGSLEDAGDSIRQDHIVFDQKNMHALPISQ